MKWTLEKIQIEANKYLTRGSFQKKSPKAYDAAHGRKLLDVVCIHMTRSRALPYSRDQLLAEASKYKTRNNFRKGSPSVYLAAWKRSDFDEICSHMEVPSNKPYTDEEIYAGALKYNNRGDFQKFDNSMYRAAWKKDILEQVCLHMRPSTGSSFEERELFCIIKSVYPTAKKMRDMRVKINNKPYIYGFDIDIVVENKGIEFDGKYYHSFEYMRKQKSRKDWPDEDIRNYHQIKDDWFASKGIQILHIKEEDWIANKEKCVRRCLEFFSQKD